ncbi:MAG: hypothetical protein ABIJ18_01415 [archaeon]
MTYWTTTYEMLDTYFEYIECRSRLKTALRVLFTGKVKLEWTAKHSAKNKRLRITGKSKILWRNK